MEEKRQKLLEILEEENKVYMEKYDEITKKWPDILALKHPLDIHDEIELQNARGLEILKKKDDFIALLKQELQNADLMFTEDVKKQNEDINLLIERMESQVSVFLTAKKKKEKEFLNNFLNIYLFIIRILKKNKKFLKKKIYILSKR